METIVTSEEILKADENLAVEYQSLLETKDSEKIVNFMKSHGVSDENIQFLQKRTEILDNAPTIQKFNTKIQADKELYARYLELTKLNNENAIIDFMKEHGVSNKDIQSLTNRELSDEELDGVNGGCGVIIFLGCVAVVTAVAGFKMVEEAD